MEQFNHPKWTNLKIYPELGILKKEIGLINDIIESYNSNINVKINSKQLNLISSNLKTFKSVNFNVLVYSDTSYTGVCDILIAPNIHDDFYRKIPFGDKFIHFSIDAYTVFNKHFSYYLKNGNFEYDNLICLAMIVKDAGPDFENVLTENLPFFDRWCILDTGSTDGTQEIIKRVLKDKKGTLYSEPFVDFKVSRNRCLDLAGTTCDFICTLDDTYVLKGDLRKFLTEVRGDTVSDSFSLLIQSDDSEYYSNRIIKSKTGLRYIHTIHEVITDKNNINITIPFDEAYIFDKRSDYMETRTNSRKQLDLDLLFKELKATPNDPRSLYYIAQTYGCINDEINKAKYFELRIKQEGYVQERIDAFFELARTYNFKLNPLTKEYYQPNHKLTETQWKICESLYHQAYQLDTKRPDSLYFIGIHYYLDKDYDKAYVYFKKAFEIGYPITSQYSLKPTLSYQFLPKFLTEVCYYVENYNLGFSAAELFLSKNKKTTESYDAITNWYQIHKRLKEMPHPTKVAIEEGRIFCIVTDGGWEPWTGRDIETKGLGGSETWVINTAQNLKENFNVVVFCNTDTSEIYNGVGYNPINKFSSFVATTKIEYCIISRYTEYVPVALKGHAENVGVIFHDLLPPEVVLPIDPKLKWLFGLTDWHRDHIKKIFPQFEVKSSYYGVSDIGPAKEKIKNSFIYSSFPNRGLVILLRMWPRIKQILPDAVLNVYCDLEHAWTNKVSPEMMKEIKETIHQENIILHGWVSKIELMEAWNTADYWLYTCIFEETFCLTAMEAAMSKTKVITNGLAGLAETAKYGITIPGHASTAEWQDSCLKQLKSISVAYPESLIEKNYRFAKSMSWQNQTDRFVNKLDPVYSILL
jgi:hypothetical protein